ncbi:hypothetical protein H0X32_00275 [Patescibacteria group bacterium]|nr:hypothetical protein [Patescibacteria group bacterium]
MSKNSTKHPSKKQDNDQQRSLFVSGACAFSVYLILLGTLSFSNIFSVQYSRADFQAKSATASTTPTEGTTATVPVVMPLDTVAYDAKMLSLANYASTTSSTTARLWPTKAPYPLAGALLPFHRIVAYYGNFYSTKMGVLGKYPPAQMIPMLQAAAAKWQAADPSTPVIPAIDYIAITAQGSPGADGKYRFRMPASQIQEALDLAAQVHGIVILDIQVGLSSVQTEVPLLEPYLKLPNVELALDPEFDMKTGAKPGTVIGTMSSSDINFAANYLAKLVQENNLPPKILVVHRFTEHMVTGYQNINPLPEVQIVMDMDGWGSPAKKINTFTQFVHNEPIQFAGFKLFYVNDLKPPSTRMLTPAEVLKLSPQPLFIQYQ